jgi:hypothetical protein
MSNRQGQSRAVLLATIVFVLGVAAMSGFSQAASVTPFSGTIVSIKGTSVTLALANKTQKTLILPGSTLVLERDPAAVEQIRAGDALGVTTRNSGSELIATNVNIFAKELWEVVRKGQWLMNSGETMTNAIVNEYAQGMHGHTLKMMYAEGTTTITVPDATPVHLFVNVKPTALAPGMQITVRRTGASGILIISFDGPAKN